MWTQTNDRYLDRGGCGDELYLDAHLKASAVLAGFYGSELVDDVETFDELADETTEAADDAAAH